jgi:hypothetical protein
MPEDLQQFANTCTAIAKVFDDGVKAMQSLCDAEIAPATIGCDVNHRPPETRTAIIGFSDGQIVVIQEIGSFTVEQLENLAREYGGAMEKGTAAAIQMAGAFDKIPEIHLPMQPHEHRNDALPYLMRNKSKYSVPNNFKGKHVPYRQKHHQRKTGRR